MLQRLAFASLALTACATPADPKSRQDELFDPDVVQEIRLDIADADLATLEASAMSAPGTDYVYVPATFHWKDVTLENVGIRYKGNSSRTTGDMWKKSYLLKFDELTPNQQLFGLKRLGLDNAIQFGSLFSERMIDEILAAED